MGRRSANGPGADAHPSRAAIAGHPIHPMLVPLPIGLLVAAAASDVAHAATGDRFFGRASRLLIGGGIATGLAAAPFGLLDFVSIDAARRRPEAWLHGIGNVAVIGLSAANLALRLRDGDRRAAAAGLAMSCAAAGILGVTGWLGGELSYRHRIGVVARQGGGKKRSRGSAKRHDAEGAAVAVMDDDASGRLDPSLVAD
jgi:uncharacterized membrane protein